jgi:hypothetical protein
MKSNLQHRLPHCYSIAYPIVTASLTPLYNPKTASLTPLYIKDLKDIKSFNRTGKRRFNPGLFPLNAMKDMGFNLIYLHCVSNKKRGKIKINNTNVIEQDNPKELNNLKNSLYKSKCKRLEMIDGFNNPFFITNTM